MSASAKAPEELHAELDGRGRIREASVSLAAFVNAEPGQLVGIALDELSITGSRRTLIRALRDAADFQVEVGPVDLWMQVDNGRIRIGRFWVRPAGIEGRYLVRGVDLSSLDTHTRRDALENLLLGWMATGIRSDQVLRGLAQLVEWQLPGVSCVVALVHDDGMVRAHSAPTLPATIVSLLDAMRPEHPLAADARATSGVRIHDVEVVDPELAGHLATHGLESVWSVRIDDLDGGLLGILAVVASPGRRCGGEELSFLRHATDIAASAIAAERGERERLHRMMYDSTTGLPNRSRLIELIDRSLDDAEHSGARTGVLMVDLDEFKVVNDSISHAAGDEVLVHVAGELRDVVGPRDRVGRFGGDEFLVVTTVQTPSEAVELADRVRQRLDGAVRVGEHFVRTGVSIGIAVSDESDDAKTLLRDADAALHRAKNEGRNRAVLFDRAIRADMLERVETEGALRRGMAKREIEFHYQPIVQLDPIMAVGAEALMRWRRDGAGVLLGPGHFLPVAETAGLIEQLGLDVLQDAVQLATELRANGHPQLSLSVNVSPQQLNSRLVPNVAAILRDAGLAPDAICLEITESALVWDGAEYVIRQLAGLGVGIAIDDFGTGYSSLNHLRRFPMATALKIDRTFVADLEGPAPSGQAIVSAAISLGHSLGMRVTAEGVERLGQFRLLRELACDRAQGFLLGKAVPRCDLGVVLDEVVGRVGPS